MRRRIAVATAAAVALGALGAVAASASSNWTAATVGSPQGYFDFCQDKQLDVAGITAADLAGDNNGGNDYGISSVIYPNDEPGQPLNVQNSYDSPGFFSFVRSKSGVTIEAPSGPERQILLTQFVEFRDSAAEHPTQIRCKMRTAASLNQAGFQRDSDTPPVFSDVPWGFGDGTATGPEGTCSAVNQESITNAWSTLTEQEKDDAPYRPEPRDGDPTNLVVEPDVETPTGPDWTLPWNALQTDAGQLQVRAKSLVVDTNAGGVDGDKFRGAHYCTFVAPEYLVEVFKGAVTPPAAPANPGLYTP